jgi:cytochrome c553
MTFSKWILPGLVGAALAACGGAKQPAEAPSSAEAETEQPQKKWHDLKTQDEKLEFMGLVVMPKMQQLFAEYDAQGYKEFKCQTCHGEDMKEQNYKMPNGLFALQKTDTLKASTEYDAEMTKFMLDKVLPSMAELLDEELGKEFTCMSCHETEE